LNYDTIDVTEEVKLQRDPDKETKMATPSTLSKKPWTTPQLVIFGTAMQITGANATKLVGSWDDQEGNQNNPNDNQCPKSEFNFSNGTCNIHS
jgi:hypothetical protein